MDAINQKISEKIIASGEAMLVTKILQNQIVLSTCLINPRTEFKDVMQTIDACEKIGMESF